MPIWGSEFTKTSMSSLRHIYDVDTDIKAHDEDSSSFLSSCDALNSRTTQMGWPGVVPSNFIQRNR